MPSWAGTERENPPALHLNGLLEPSSGQVRVGDIPVTPKTVARVRESVGMVFQQADDQLFMPTVREDVAFGPLNMGLPPEEVSRRVRQALRDVHAEALADKMTHHLSGGEKRAVSIATVLSMTPDILVLDEPSANLDPASRRTLISLLRQFSHTKIIATHDLDMVMDLCTRCIVMKDRIPSGGRARSGHFRRLRFAGRSAPGTTPQLPPDAVRQGEGELRPILRRKNSSHKLQTRIRQGLDEPRPVPLGGHAGVQDHHHAGIAPRADQPPHALPQLQNGYGHGILVKRVPPARPDALKAGSPPAGGPAPQTAGASQ